MKFPTLKPRIEIWNDADANKAALLAQLANIEAENKANSETLKSLNKEIEQAKKDGWTPPPLVWLARCTEHYAGKPGNAKAKPMIPGDEFEYTCEIIPPVGSGGSPVGDAFIVQARSAYALASGVLVEAAARRCDALTVVFKHATTEAATDWTEARARSWLPCLQAAHAVATPRLSIDLLFPQPRDSGGHFFKPLRLRPSPLAAAA